MKKKIVFLLSFFLLFFIVCVRAKSVSVPLFGDFPFVARETGNVKVEALPDRDYGFISFTENAVKTWPEKIIMTTTINFLGVQVRGEYQKSFFLVDDRSKDYTFDLKSMDNKPIVFAGIAFSNAQLIINEEEKFLKLQGTFKFLDLVFNGGFYVSLDFVKPEDDGGWRSVKMNSKILFFASLSPSIKEWYPFKGVKVPSLEGIRLYNLGVGFQAGYVRTATFENKQMAELESASKRPGGLLSALSIEGMVDILNTSVRGSIDVGFDAQAGWRLTGSLRMPKGWKLAQSFPQIKKIPGVFSDALQLLELEDALLILSTKSGQIFLGDGSMYRVKTGVNLQASLVLDTKRAEQNVILKTLDRVIVQGFLKGSLKKLGSDKPRLSVEGLLPPDFKTFSLSVGLTGGDYGFRLGPLSLYGGQLALVLTGEPSLGFAGRFLCKPTPADKPLDLFVEFKFTPIAFGLGGSVSGIWKNPFGIKGFEFGNLGLVGTQTYTALVEAAEAAAASAGVGFLVALIPETAGIAGEAKIGTGPDPLYLKILLSLGKNIANVGIIGEIQNPLLSIARLVELLFAQAGVSLRLPNMLPLRVKKGSVYFVPLGTRIGGIKLEQGVGFSVYVTLLGRDAHLDAALDWTRGVVLKGTVPALKIGPFLFTGANGVGDPFIDCELSSEQQHLKIFGQLILDPILKSNTDIDVSLEGLKFDTETKIGPSGAEFGVKIKGKTLPSLTPEMLQKLKPEDIGVEIEFKNDLTTALNNVVNQTLLARKAEFENDINAMIVQVARRTNERDIQEQAARVAQAQKNRVYFFVNPPLSIEREAIVKREELKLLALQAKQRLEQLDPFGFVKKIADATGISALITASLEGFKRVGVGSFEAGRFLFNRIVNLVVVRKIAWAGTAADFKNYTIPGVTVEFDIAGKPIKHTFSTFDLRNPATSIQQIANQIVVLGFDAIKKAVAV